MLPRYHTYIGAPISLLLWFLFDFPSGVILIFFISSILIDLDHYTFYLWKKKDLNFYNAYAWFENPNNGAQHYLFLHGIEPLILLWILSKHAPIFRSMFLGFLFHHIVDYAYSIYKKRIPTNKISQVWFLIKKNKEKEKFL